MPIDQTKNSRVVFVMPIPLREEMERLAKLDRRTLGAYIRNLCEDHVKAERSREKGL